MIRAAVLGADVRKSRSPVIHRAAFRAMGVRGQYGAISVGDREFRRLVRELFEKRGFRYLNVTIPHKAQAAALADLRGPEVRVARAANTLIFDAATGAVTAENTDGSGLIAALGDLGVSPRAAVIVLVGAGGAAAGALEALTRAGARVRVLARRAPAARALRARLPASRRARVTAGVWTTQTMARALRGATALVSAVPAAAWSGEAARQGLAALERDTAVLEMAYGGTTPLATAARRHASRYADGLGMLAHQAARAIELALGRAPPVDPMLRAARRG